MKSCGKGRSHFQRRYAWNSCNPIQNLGDLSNSLTRVMSSLRKWSYDKFGSVTRELTSIRKRMDELNSQHLDQHQEELDRLRTPMDEVLYRKEMMWL
jgi:hypothetical protein